MEAEKLAQDWQDRFAGAAASMAKWRAEHPRATLREMEEAVDKQLAGVRTRMLVDSVQASGAAEFSVLPARQRPKCPECSDPLASRGKRERVLLTTQGQELRIRRQYGQCQSCGTELFPPG